MNQFQSLAVDSTYGSAGKSYEAIKSDMQRRYGNYDTHVEGNTKVPAENPKTQPRTGN
jgi:hypothetical protein